MRYLMLIVLLSGSSFGQALVENAAAAAGGSAGGVAGKKLSDGLSAVLNRVSGQTGKAAEADKTQPARDRGKDSANQVPLVQAGPGTPKSAIDSVPDAPPLKEHHAALRKPAPIPLPEPVQAAPVPAPPPPPQMTAEELAKVNTGMNREDLLKMGAPASKITMFDDGHLVEIYHYSAHDTSLGVVRLSDGAVSSVEKK